MFSQMNEVKGYYYGTNYISIFSHPTDDGKGSYYDTFCFAIFTLDKDGGPDDILFDSETKGIFADEIGEAMDIAERYQEGIASQENEK